MQREGNAVSLASRGEQPPEDIRVRHADLREEEAGVKAAGRDEMRWDEEVG